MFFFDEEFDRKVDFEKGVNHFLENNLILLEKKVNERSLTHKLAESLQLFFPDYNVDCEYNRMIKDSEFIVKKLDFLELEKPNAINQKTIFPDIIIHTRNSNQKNFAVIEVKKKSNNSSEKKDLNKLKYFKKELNYKIALFLKFDENSVYKYNIVN